MNPQRPAMRSYNETNFPLKIFQQKHLRLVILVLYLVLDESRDGALLKKIINKERGTTITITF